jgi:hypothetical protein
MYRESSDALAPTRARHKPTSQSKHTKWTSEEDTILVKLRKQNPDCNLGEFVHLFAGKTVQQIAERWDKVLNPSLVKGSWTREEDETIIEFVQREGTKNWTQLAALLPGRIGKQCRERWRNHLDPEVNREAWTEAEDEILIDLHERIGNQWVKITESLPGRSDNAIKNRWNSTLRKRLEALRTGTPRKRRGRPAKGALAPKSADDIPRPPKFEEIQQTVPSPLRSSEAPWLSPLMAIRSPCQNLKSPFPLSWADGKDQAFAFGTPMFEASERLFDGIPAFSPMLFGGSDTRADLANLCSPKLPK